MALAGARDDMNERMPRCQGRGIEPTDRRIAIAMQQDRGYEIEE